VALNIAVYLFGLASPLEVPGMVDASLPFLYGAKVNELIVNGEWWRLVTPTFLVNCDCPVLSCPCFDYLMGTVIR